MDDKAFYALLGAQVLVGGLAGLIGFHLMIYAFGEGSPKNSDAGAAYAVLGFALIFFGGFLLFGIPSTWVLLHYPAAGG